jgi:hypothetical protein
LGGAIISEGSCLGLKMLLQDLVVSGWHEITLVVWDNLMVTLK